MTRRILARSLAILALAAPAGPGPAAADDPYPGGVAPALSELLARHVRDGLVDYAAVARDTLGVRRVARRIADASPDTFASDADRKAFWIDAYNFLALASAARRWPLASVRDVPGFFDRERHAVAGRRLTLDAIEREVLARFGDPRVHLALVCAARGCPPLGPEAWSGGDVDAALEARAREIARDPRHVEADPARGRLRLSRIFDWHGAEFSREAGSVRAWIDARRDDPLPAGLATEWIAWDWSLNGPLPPAGSGAGAGRPRDLAAYGPADLLRPGETEIELFQNLYTQTEFFDDDGDRTPAGGRSTYWTAILSVTGGWRARANLGVDVTLKSVRDETATRRDPPAETDSRTRLVSIAPRVEFAPWPSRPSLSLETALSIPLGGHLDGGDGDDLDPFPEGPFLDFGDLAWISTARLDRDLAADLVLYGELGTIVRVDPDAGDGQLTTPLKAILNWHPAPRWTLYAPLEAAPDWVGDGRGDYWTQAGVGVKWRPVPNVELEALGTAFPLGRNAGAGATANLGVRWVRSTPRLSRGR